MLRLADDIPLLANTERELEEALNVTETVFIKYNQKKNIRKTKAIACRTKPGKKRLNIKIGNEKIGEINEYCYRSDADIRSRIGQAKKAFAKLHGETLYSNIYNIYNIYIYIYLFDKFIQDILIAYLLFLNCIF